MTRPRSIYQRSHGTVKGVIPAPHDQHKYSGCKYVGPRTLIKCKELRTKDKLASNRGLCDQHTFIPKICARQQEVENELLKQEVDQKTSVKFEQALRLDNGNIVDPTYLVEKSDWRGSVADVLNVKSVIEEDEHPLSRAEIVSEKEFIRVQLALLQKRTLKLREMRQRNEDKAKCRMHQLGLGSENFIDELAAGSSKKLDDDPVTKNILKTHDNSIRMEMELQDKVDAETNRKTNLSACSYVWDEGKQKCTRNVLPASQLCEKHILMSTEQKMFIPCTICRAPATDPGDDHPVCADHIINRLTKIFSPGGTTAHTYRVPNEAMMKGVPAWHRYEGRSPTQFKEVFLDGKSPIEDEEKSQEEKNSPMNLPSVGQKPSAARKKTWDGPAGKLALKSNDTFLAALYGNTPLPTTKGRKGQVNDPSTMTCARVRLFTKDEFAKSHANFGRGSREMMQPRMRMPVHMEMNDHQQALGPPSGSLLPGAPSSLSHHPMHSHPNHPASLHPRVNPTFERSKSSRVYLSHPSSHQEALSKMYGKSPAYPPSMKKEQERRLPLPPTSRQPANRSSFPLGKTQAATPFGRALTSDQSTSSGGLTGSLTPSKMHQSTTNPSYQWSPLTSSRSPYLPPPPPRQTPQLKPLQRESLLNKQTPSKSGPIWGQQFQFKPVGRGAPQLPVKQAIIEDNKSQSIGRPPMGMGRTPDQSLPSTSQSTVKTVSNTSIPALSSKDGMDTPIFSPLSSPPQLTLEKAEASTSKESEKSEGTAIRFDEHIDDIEEEEDDFEEEL